VSELEAAMLEFVTDANRLGYTLGEIAYELAGYGRLGLDWPVASVNEWFAVGEKMVRDGRLMQDGGKVVLPVESVVTQLELF
jgi:hypothetical protein